MKKTRGHEHILRSPSELEARIGFLEGELEKALAELEALRRSERTRLEVCDRLPVGMLALDVEGRVIAANQTYCNLAGLEIEALKGAPALPREAHLGSSAVEKAVGKLLSSGRAFDIDLPPSSALAGGEHYLSVHGESLWDLTGLCQGYLILVEDMAGRDEAGARLKSSLGYLRRIILGTVEAMSVMVERRDPFVAGHMRRVAELAAAIAGEMNLDAFEVEGVRISALLHDIGKIAIPSEILCKPARLSAAERGILRTHPFVAQRILKRIPFPWPVAETVLQHAERLDGSGYPQGIEGDEIILQARIVAVADTVEAMLTYRPYRPAQPLSAVMAEIQANRGRRYDPRVVDACVRLLREKGFEFKT